jgi:hypothetical protein
MAAMEEEPGDIEDTLVVGGAADEAHDETAPPSALAAEAARVRKTYGDHYGGNAAVTASFLLEDSIQAWGALPSGLPTCVRRGGTMSGGQGAPRQLRYTLTPPARAFHFHPQS